MLEPIPLSSDRHHTLHSGAAHLVRTELITWLEAELTRLQHQMAHQTDLHTMLRFQGAIQVLQLILEPLVNNPTHPRPPPGSPY